MAEPAPPVPTLELSTAVSDTDHGKIVTVVTLLCLVLTVIFTAARLQSRWPWRSLFGKDDMLTVAATVMTIVQSSVVLRAIDDHFGETEDQLSETQIRSSKKTLYASGILFVISLSLGKLGVAFLFHRLAASTSKIRASWAFSGTVAVLGIAQVFVAAIQQDASEPWRFDDGTADSNLKHWMAIGILNILIDIAVSLFPLYLVAGVQIDNGAKATVSVAFALRLPTIAFTVLRLVAISRTDPNNWSFDYVMPGIYTQLEMHYNLISATIPCLRIVLKSWNTSFMNLGLEEMDSEAYAHHSSGKGQSYNMSMLGRSKNKSGNKSNPGPSSSNIQSSSGAWYGSSQATAGRSQAVKGDAASDSSEKAIVVKQTIDVDVN